MLQIQIRQGLKYANYLISKGIHICLQFKSVEIYCQIGFYVLSNITK